MPIRSCKLPDGSDGFQREGQGKCYADGFALDKSARRTDEDGRLHIDRSHISKAAINPYYGQEIPGYEQLGLDANTVYKLFRDPAELAKAAPTFARLPILSDHVPTTVDNPQGDLVIGAIGSNVAFDSPYLDADLCFWDKEAIAGIETKKVHELSSAYRYDPVMEAGEYEGESYDGRMTNIRGNHLALVEVGRAGSDVVVADQNPFVNEDSQMRMTKLGKALFVAISAASPVLAQDSALPGLVGNANRKTFKKAEVRDKLIALDATLSPQQLDNVIDALLDVEQDPMPQEMDEPAAAADESPEEKVKAMLDGKVDEDTINAICAMLPKEAAVDEEPDNLKDDKADKPEDVKAAMDSAISKVRAQLREADEARRDVADVIGNVYGMDSAADIYALALDEMKVDHKGVKDANSLRAIFNAVSAKASAPAPRIAQDSNGLATQHPNAMRFGHA